MRTEVKLFLYLALFMLPLWLVYVWLGKEEVGVILLFVTSVSFAFIGTYLLIQSRRMNGLRPEDFDAEIADGAGEVGSFPVGSIWPFVAAMGVTTIALGLVFTAILVIPGLGLILTAVIGMARESSVAQIGHVDIDAHNVMTEGPPSDFTDQVKK